MTPVARLLHRGVRLYQRVTDGRPSPCRYVPTCSNYALDALEAVLPAYADLLAALAAAGAVEVQIDDGQWQEAELGPDVGNDYWRQWFFRWQARPGPHTVSARVTSGDGELQTTERAQPFPDGASGVQALRVTVTG